MHRGEHEHNILSIWKRAAGKSKGTIIDCGGYNGIFGLVAAKVNPDANIIIIEPDHININHIKYNIKLNNLNNITIIPAVVSDCMGTVMFQSDGGHSGCFSANVGTNVQSVMLDNYKNVSLVKIDIEGAEYQALIGGQNMVESGVNILLELHKDFLDRFFATESDIWNLLRKYDYKNLFLHTTKINEEHYWIYKGK